MLQQKLEEWAGLEDLKRQIAAFLPPTPSQKEAKSRLLQALDKEGASLLTRENPQIHLTVGAFTLSPDFSKTLMVHHLIYNAFCWTGGHADGETDLLAKAMEETKEETGVSTLWQLSSDILGIYLLPVPAHEKKGKSIAAHHHFVVAYGLIAPEKQKLAVKPDENKAVAWFPVEEIPSRCTEQHMLPIYQELYEQMQSIQRRRQELFASLPKLLLPWYEQCRRDLPWRKNQDPYAVWVSEIMLQQTRVEAVKGYYARFMAALPTIEALANVPEQQLLKLWEGLGYYSRVRNLQKAACLIMAEYGGAFPQDYDQIRKLPGIGDYTAGAIASICFDAPKAAVDGNVLRVGARVTKDFAPIHLPLIKKQLAEHLEEIYPPGQCGAFTQSLMELGATVCLPNGMPKCGICPLRERCLSAGAETAITLPIKQGKKPRRVEERTVWIFQMGDKIGLTQRQEPGLLAGYWQFPNVLGRLSAQEALNQAAAWGLAPRGLWYETAKKHIFTHIEWHMQAYYITCSQPGEGFTWVSLTELEEKIPLPGAFRLFLPPLYER